MQHLKAEKLCQHPTSRNCEFSVSFTYYVFYLGGKTFQNSEPFTEKDG